MSETGSSETGTGGDGVGSTQPAGAAVSDDEMARQVADQTSGDLLASSVFERDEDGVDHPTAAAEASADELETNG